MNIPDILGDIKVGVGLTDPEQVALLSRTMVRATELGARQLAGEDVSEELAIVKATALNLSEHVRNVALTKLSMAFTSILQKALT